MAGKVKMAPKVRMMRTATVPKGAKKKPLSAKRTPRGPAPLKPIRVGVR